MIKYLQIEAKRDKYYYQSRDMKSRIQDIKYQPKTKKKKLFILQNASRNRRNLAEYGNS